MRLLYHLDGAEDRLLFGDRPPNPILRKWQRLDFLRRDVLGELEMDGAGALFLGQTKGLPDPRGYIAAADNLAGVFGQRTHHLHYVDDLKLSLLTGLDGLLSRDHHHRHPPQLGLGGCRYQIGCARAQGGETNAGLPRESAIGGCHEASRLLVPRQNQLDLVRLSQRVEKIKILLPGYPEDELDSLLFQ